MKTFVAPRESFRQDTTVYAAYAMVVATQGILTESKPKAFMCRTMYKSETESYAFGRKSTLYQ